MASSAQTPAASFSLTLEWPTPLRRVRLALAAVELAVAIPAVPSGIALIRDGMGLNTAWIDHTLLPDYTVPGLLLLVVIGGGMPLAAAAALWRPRLALPAALAMGTVLLAWLAIETLMIGWHGGPQLGLDLVYGALGLGLVAAGLRTVRVRRSP
jgi:hypothetical protein